MIAYRSDIDGLRAIAILSVVLYHAHEALLPGGFTGVDVFFVISGYLITKLIAADIAKGRFSIARFYVRRTKRIFPALFVVLLATLVAGAFLLPPSELRALGRSVAATAAFVSNIAFWQDTGYFDVAAETKPLLHTWSLAVEEQFYLLWPLALFLLTKMRVNLRGAVGVAIVLSFVVSCYAAVARPAEAFFLLPPRAWELLAGAALALGLLPTPSSARARDAAALAGLVLVAAGVLFLDRASYFPGWNALLPCVGTALLIAASEQGDNVVARQLLSRRPMVLVGLISYSLYLWHWPLLAFARVTERGTLDVGPALLVVAAAVVLSALTWRFVEQPLRAKASTAPVAPVLLRYAALSIAVFAAGAYAYSTNGFLQSASPEIAWTEAARYDGNPLSSACLRWQSETGPLPGERCLSNQDRFSQRLVVWGDSHADSVAPGVVGYAAEHGYATYQLSMAACPPLVEVELDGPGIDYRPCTAFNRQVLEYVTTDPDVRVVLLSARWGLYTENERFGRDDPGPITYLVDPGSPALSPEASKRAFTRALDATVAKLREAGRTVLVLGGVPPVGVNVPDCLARNYLPLSDSRDCGVPEAAVLPHLAYSDDVIEAVSAKYSGVCTYLPRRAFCPNGRCMDTRGGDILYANDDHISSRGAEFLASSFDFEQCLSRGAADRSSTLIGSDSGR